MMASTTTDASEQLHPGTTGSGLPAKAGDVRKGERGTGTTAGDPIEGRLALHLVLSGSATYQVGAQRYHVSPSSLFWVFPVQPSEAVHASPDHEVWLASFEPQLAARVVV